VRQRGRSTSKPALALRVGLEPGLTRAAEERGPLPPVSEFCRSRSFLRICRGSGAVREPREPDGCSIGRQVIHLAPHRLSPGGATPGLKPVMRCWEILTVAPQRRCRDDDMRLESCPPHDRSTQITWPRKFYVCVASDKNLPKYQHFEYLVCAKIDRSAFSQNETLLWLIPAVRPCTTHSNAIGSTVRIT
jgi:hypothetical protein